MFEYAATVSDTGGTKADGNICAAAAGTGNGGSYRGNESKGRRDNRTLGQHGEADSIGMLRLSLIIKLL